MNITTEEGRPTMTRKGFEKLIAKTYGEDVIDALRDEITRCDCGSPFCRGWRIDPDRVIDIISARES